MEDQIRQLLLHAIVLISVIIFLLVFGKKISKYAVELLRSINSRLREWKRLRYTNRLNRREERMFGRDQKVDGIRRVSSNNQKRKYKKHRKHSNRSTDSDSKSVKKKF